MTEPIPSATGIRLRNIKASVVTGTDAPTLETALNTFFAAAGQTVLVAAYRVADYKVLILYAE